jgi:hypothetical protein
MRLATSAERMALLLELGTWTTDSGRGIHLDRDNGLWAEPYQSPARVRVTAPMVRGILLASGLAEHQPGTEGFLITEQPHGRIRVEPAPRGTLNVPAWKGSAASTGKPSTAPAWSGKSTDSPTCSPPARSPGQRKRGPGRFRTRLPIPHGAASPAPCPSEHPAAARGLVSHARSGALPAGITNRVDRFCRTPGTANMYYVLRGYTFTGHGTRHGPGTLGHGGLDLWAPMFAPCSLGCPGTPRQHAVSAASRKDERPYKMAGPGRSRYLSAPGQGEEPNKAADS